MNILKRKLGILKKIKFNCVHKVCWDSNVRLTLIVRGKFGSLLKVFFNSINSDTFHVWSKFADGLWPMFYVAALCKTSAHLRREV